MNEVVVTPDDLEEILDEINKNYFTRKIWAYEKEIDLGMKTIKGEIGMAIFEPRVPLKDGFYLLDQGIPVMGETHRDLNIHPKGWDVRPKYMKRMVMHFMIGKRSVIEKLSKPRKISETKESKGDNNSEDKSGNLEKSVNKF